MKKSLIALAVAGALTAPMIAQADATLYGSMRLELNDWDSADSIDLNDNSSRVGIKGDVDLGLEDTKGIFQWEFNISTADDDAYGSQAIGERIAVVGATGSWGTALFGRQYHPHFLMMNLNTYTFNDASIAEAFFLGNTGHKRTEDTLAYVSPTMNGVTLAAGIVVDNDSTAQDNENVDGHNIAAKYAGNGLTAAISFGDLKGNGNVGTDREVWGLSAKYAINDAATIMARYEEAEQATAVTDQEVYYLGGTYKIDNTTIKLAYADLETQRGTAAEVDGDYWALEVNQKMGKGQAYVAYADFSDIKAGTITKGATLEAETGTNDDVLTIGYRLDF